MKKFFLAIVLLVLIIAVSYLKAVRDRDKTDDSFESGRKSSEMKALALAGDIDSLQQYIGQQNVTLAESLTIQQKAYLKELDSMANIVDSKDFKINELNQQLKQASKKKSTARSSKPEYDKHQELLAFYKKRFESLPGDLTNYERRVALTEIRQETVRKYSMSVTDLNKIREKII